MSMWVSGAECPRARPLPAPKTCRQCPRGAACVPRRQRMWAPAHGSLPRLKWGTTSGLLGGTGEPSSRTLVMGCRSPHTPGQKGHEERPPSWGPGCSQWGPGGRGSKANGSSRAGSPEWTLHQTRGVACAHVVCAWCGMCACGVHMWCGMCMCCGMCTCGVCM